MATTLSRARTIEEFVCGIPRQESYWQAHSLDIQVRSCLWHSHQMATTSSQVRMMKQFVCGMPRGHHIVSGSHDGTIRVWNAITGETVAGPFTGHTDSVKSVAFSPDGHHIASGSDDETIRVWNVTTGETVAGPFTGHTDSVNSVAFSPDGRHIVSGSKDRTIRVLNATTGETVPDLFTGQASSVQSVAFSPDGHHIISGSSTSFLSQFSHETLRVWNATTGETVADPFTGYRDTVSSVAFSPDGHHIVSGSFDRTIRVWNATTGETVAGPFTGHRGPINSVAFSPNGHHIVSSSNDRTIRISDVTKWKTETKNDVDFTDHSVINDEGWICGSKGELLMWIPPMHREHLHHPSTIWTSGEHETRLDLSTFVHGRSWATCIDT